MTELHVASTLPPMHVGLNLHFLVGASGGTTTYARELMTSLFAVEPETRVTAFVTAQAPVELLERDFGGEVRWVRLPGSVVGGPPWNSLTSIVSQWALQPGLAWAAGVDVLHGLASAVAPLSAVPTVATVLDLTWHHVPGTMTRRDTLGMRVMTRASAARADRLIAISEAGRDDLVATLRVDVDRVDVTPLGTRAPDAATATPPDELRARHRLGDGPLILCVAQKRSHKGLDTLIRALGQVGVDGATLVLPGTPTPYEDDLRRLAMAHGVAHRVAFPGWVDDADLEGLYAAASCFVLASRMEGFGLPLAEAMQRGLPVACSDVSALPEVSGDAALRFDPADETSVAAAMRRLLTEPELAAGLAARGRRRARELTWDRTAQATLASYRRAIAQRRG